MAYKQAGSKCRTLLGPPYLPIYGCAHALYFHIG